MFQEMTIHDNIQKYFYMGREILDYSGKNLGVMLIRLSEKKIWGKLAAGMVTEEGGALYILDLQRFHPTRYIVRSLHYFRFEQRLQR